jgi:hypothetical protein
MACPGHFILRKETQYPMYMRLVGLGSILDRSGKSHPPLGFKPQDSPACRRRGSISVGLFHVDRTRSSPSTRILYNRKCREKITSLSSKGTFIHLTN